MLPIEDRQFRQTQAGQQRISQIEAQSAAAKERLAMTLEQRTEQNIRDNATRQGIASERLKADAETMTQTCTVDPTRIAGRVLHYFTEGNPPSPGMGGSGIAAQVRDATELLAGEVGMDGGDNFTISRNRIKEIAKSRAIQQRESDGAEIFANSIMGSLEIMDETAGAISNTGLTRINSLFFNARRNMDNEDIAKINAVLSDVSTDVARAFIAPGSSAMLSEGARQEFMSIFDKGYSWPVLRATIEESIRSLMARVGEHVKKIDSLPR